MKTTPANTRAAAFCFALTLALVGCQSIYYGTMSSFGYEKRDLLVERVKDARDEQEDAKAQFTSALDQFKAVIDFQGDDLEAMYEELDRGYNKSRRAASDVGDKIDAVESVAEALFDEWAEELDAYNSEDLRTISAQRLEETRSRYEQLLGAMRRAEESIPPVLAEMQDQVLFLKHNLNAQAVASIQGTAEGINRDIQALIDQMESSILEANAFINQMGGADQ
ncbi:MAG: DUF2959 domain-containing protein [Phycisphaeraceae bacterium]